MHAVGSHIPEMAFGLVKGPITVSPADLCWGLLSTTVSWVWLLDILNENSEKMLPMPRFKPRTSIMPARKPLCNGRPYVTYTQKIWSGVDNFHLDDFFEEFSCGRWYIYLEQTIYHLCRPISCWLSLSSLTVEYHLLWTIISYVVWYSFPSDDIQLKPDNTHLTWIIFS
jgi:hypothetical protein